MKLRRSWNWAELKSKDIIPKGTFRKDIVIVASVSAYVVEAWKTVPNILVQLGFW